MYGQKFVAAFLFLAVADVEVNAYSHYGSYGGYGGYDVEDVEDDFESAPAPEGYHNGDNGTVVDFPVDSDSWDFSHAVFHLHENEDNLEDWAASVADDKT